MGVKGYTLKYFWALLTANTLDFCPRDVRAPRIDIVDKEGKNLYISREKIKKFKIQKISSMPGNFGDLLKVKDVTDVLAYLESLTLPVITNSEN